MNSSCLLALFALALSLPAAAAEETKPAPPPPPTFYVDDPANWTQPTKVLPPEYPEELFKRGVTGYVDAKVRISPLGRALDVISVTSEPKVPEFEKAVTEVIKHWEFAESLGSDCSPVEAVGNTRVWFDIKDGEKSLSVLRVELPLPPRFESIRMENRDEVAKRLGRAYPGIARRHGQEALTYALMEVDGNTGGVISVETSAFVGHSEFAGAFAAAVKHGFKEAKFPIKAEFKNRRFLACKTVKFSLGQ